MSKRKARCECPSPLECFSFDCEWIDCHCHGESFADIRERCKVFLQDQLSSTRFVALLKGNARLEKDLKETLSNVLDKERNPLRVEEITYFNGISAMNFTRLNDSFSIQRMEDHIENLVELNFQDSKMCESEESPLEKAIAAVAHATGFIEKMKELRAQGADADFSSLEELADTEAVRSTVRRVTESSGGPGGPGIIAVKHWDILRSEQKTIIQENQKLIAHEKRQQRKRRRNVAKIYAKAYEVELLETCYLVYPNHPKVYFFQDHRYIGNQQQILTAIRIKAFPAVTVVQDSSTAIVAGRDKGLFMYNLGPKYKYQSFFRIPIADQKRFLTSDPMRSTHESGRVLRDERGVGKSDFVLSDPI